MIKQTITITRRNNDKVSLEYENHEIKGRHIYIYIYIIYIYILGTYIYALYLIYIYTWWRPPAPSVYLVGIKINEQATTDLGRNKQTVTEMW